MIGGDVIGMGGYGCIFRPQLKCKSRRGRTKGDKISKLMTRKNGIKEYKNVKKILSYVKKIPNYRKYFILDDITKCNTYPLPDVYTKSIGKCSGSLGTDDLTKINKEITDGKLISLNVPYGGVSLLTILNTMIFSEFDKDKHLHQSFCDTLDNLVDLLLNAIVKLKTKGIYHNDIKSDNILYSYDAKTNKSYYRIIDWGVSVTTRTPSRFIDSGMRPIQWNSPFISSLVLSPIYESFPEIVGHYNIKGKSAIECASIFNKYLSNFSNQLEYIEDSILKVIFKSKTDYPKIGDILGSHMEKAMDTYNTTSRDRNKFIGNILSHNMDIYGFISIFIDLLIANHSSGYKGAIEHPLFEYMKDFVWKYYYSDRYVTTKISVPELVDDILKMKYIHAF